MQRIWVRFFWTGRLRLTKIVLVHRYSQLIEDFSPPLTLTKFRPHHLTHQLQTLNVSLPYPTLSPHRRHFPSLVNYSALLFPTTDLTPSNKYSMALLAQSMNILGSWDD